MRGDEVHPGWHQRAHVADHALLGRAHIGQDRAGGEGRRDRLGQGREGAHRGAEHHAVGALDRARGIELHPVGDAQLHHPVERFLRARVHHDLAREVAALAGDARDRGPDQPDADQGEATEQRLSHDECP